MWYSYHGYFWGMHFIWWIIWLLMIVWIFFTPWTIRNRVSNKSSAIDILQERFAKGEISKEEYEERKSILQRDQQTKKK